MVLHFSNQTQTQRISLKNHTKMSSTKRFSESSFFIKCPPSDVYNNLLNVGKCSEWSIVPGCTSLKQAILTSKSTSGIATGYVLVGNEGILCHVRILQTNRNQQIITEAHVASSPSIPLKNNSDLRDYCLENFTVTYKVEWNLRTENVSFERG